MPGVRLSSAAGWSIGGPLSTCALSMPPVREMIASMTTVPSTWAALAMDGYSGWMGAMRLPAVTPEETDKGFEEGVAAGGPTFMCGFAGAAC